MSLSSTLLVHRRIDSSDIAGRRHRKSHSWGPLFLRTDHLAVGGGQNAAESWKAIEMQISEVRGRKKRFHSHSRIKFQR